MNRNNYGATANIISQITDPNQLMQMMRNPQYAGFTQVIIARLAEIKRMQGAAQGAQPPQPTVANQAMGGEPQTMAGGGIITFKHGGEVKKIEGYRDRDAKYEELRPKEFTPPEIRRTVVEGPDISDITKDREPSVGIRSFAGGGELSTDQDSDVSDTPSPLGVWWERHKAENRALAAARGDEEPEAYQYVAPKAQGGIKQAPTGFTNAATVQPSAVNLEAPYTADETGGGLGAFRLSGAGRAHYNPMEVPDVRSAEYYAAEHKKAMGENTDLAEARKQLAEGIAARKDQAANNINMAMIRGGLGMMASKRPDTLGMAGEGGIGGLEQYTAGQQADTRARAEDLQRQVQLGAISRQEREGEFKYSSGERRMDQQTAKAIQLENAKLGLEAQKIGLSASLLKQQNNPMAMAQYYGTQRYKQAVKAYNDAVAKGQPLPPKPGHVEDYISEAATKVVPGMYGSAVRSESTSRGQYGKEKADFYKIHTLTDYFPTYENWAGGTGGGSGLVRD